MKQASKAPKTKPKTSAGKAFDWKVLKYLFWLAPILVIMGITAGLVSGSWGAVPTGLIAAGVVVALAWMISESYTQTGFWGRRSTQVGTNALLATLAVLIILGLFNYLAVRYSSRLDLTENQIFTLAPQSQDVVRSLKQPVKVSLFTPQPNPVDRELLDNYRRLNNQFSYEFIDPQAKPGVARQYNVQSIGEVYVESGTNRRFVQTLNGQDKLSERRLTNGIVQVISNRQEKVYFLQGHGERPLQQGQQGAIAQVNGRLGEENYKPELLNLAADAKIPDDASVLVLAGTQRPLLEPEVNAIKEFLKRKSGLMVLADPQTNPGLDGILQEWGVKLSDRLIVDPAGQALRLGPGVVLVNQYGDHPITRGFGNGITIFPLARPIETTAVNGVQTTPLLQTSDRTEAQRISDSGELQFDPKTDPKPPYILGAALTRNVSQDTPKPEASPAPSPAPSSAPQPQAKPEARLVVIGNSGFMADGLFGQQLNGDLFLNSMSWLSQRDDQTLAIRPKEMTNRRIVMSLEQQTAVALLAMAALPILGFGTAVVMWWRRR